MAPLPEYTYNPDDGPFVCTDDMLNDYRERGFFIVRGLFTKQEIEKIDKAITNNEAIAKHAYGIPASDDIESRLCLWSHPGNDITGMIARCEKIVTTSEKLLGGEVYHYHTKLIMKQAYTGGKFVWHQDYGYWYKNGCLLPQLLTAYIAVDKCEKINGCMQILDGSHKAGRIDHTFEGGQQGADLERVAQLSKVMDLIHVEQNPGDCMFFDSNIIHKSDVNNSATRRWAFLCSYNRASNNPAYVHHHPQYTPLHKVPDSAIMECTNFTDMTGKDFLDPTIDKTVKFKK